MLFDAATLSQLRKTQEGTMMHECTIESYTVGEDGTVSYGKTSDPTPCGFKVLEHSRKADTVLYDSIQADAELRLPLDTAIGMRDRVTLTKSFGKALSPVRHFEVCSLPDSFGPSGQVAELKEVYT